MVCNTGPGMQDRLPQQETDFFSDQPFQRRDEGDDADFFRAPSLEPFWDRRALAQVSAIYDRLIPSQADILDLMAGVHSPLQESSLDIARLYCAGLNAEELEHNPICHQRRVLNVNTIETLPFADQQFDVVLMDVEMPEMDGLELLEELRSKKSEAIVVMLTAYGSEEYAIQSFRKGANN